MPYRKQRFRLRFSGLSEQAQNAIKDALSGVSAKQRGDILLFEINESVNVSRLYEILGSLRPDPEQLEVLASVVTSSDNGGIDLPEYVLDLIRRTRCRVGFSFVNIGPDDQDDCGAEVTRARHGAQAEGPWVPRGGPARPE